MGTKGSRAPRRTATRRSSSLRLVGNGVPAAAQTAVATAGEVSVGAGSEAELLAALTGSLLGGIAAARHPLAAELVLCDMFGTVESGLPDHADDSDRVEALTAMLSGVIEHAEAIASTDALALLRVCAVLGPPATRRTAADSVRRIEAHGTPDRPWAARVGSPTVLRAWHYGDVLGAQSSIGVLFNYQGREHALMVLIDHLLGGGVKDCWIAEGRAVKNIRDNVATAMASEPNAVFEDIDLATAAELLAQALVNPPCPEQDDQIEDVARNLYLTQARQELLARLAELPATLVPAAPARPASTDPPTPVGLA